MYKYFGGKKVAPLLKILTVQFLMASDQQQIVPLGKVACHPIRR